MISSFSYDVLFEVRVKTLPDEHVCVVGDSVELGEWNPHKAVKLHQKAKGPKTTPNPLQGDTTLDDTQGDLWSRELKISSHVNLNYRFLTCRIFHSDNEDEEKSVIVTRWETNLRPRTFSLDDSLKSKTSVEESVFGVYGGTTSVTPGWLTDQTQITIHIHNNPIKLWKSKSAHQQYRIKCTPLDHQYKDDGEHDDGERLPVAARTIAFVSVLEADQSIPAKQSDYGTLYTPGHFLCFMVHTLEPEKTGYQLDFYTSPEEKDAEGKQKLPVHVGYTFVLPFDLKKSCDSKTLPITSPKHIPLGQITLDYLMVKPLISTRFLMDVCYQKYWHPAQKPLDIAHRGMGVSYGDSFYKTLSTVRENTVQSMKDAFEHGADFVELDVHLTKDKQVIVYHDFSVYITYKKKKQGELELLSIPVKYLQMTELQSMKFSHQAKLQNKDELTHEDQDPLDQQPFPTLAQCLDAVDIHCGFNVEVKYPQAMKNGHHEMDNYFDLNEFIDIILRVIFEHHNGRRIIFSSFDCDTCVALRLKQNRFPVLFLTQADTTAYELYKDVRTQSIPMAAEFCLANGLLGVNAMSRLLLENMSLIEYVKACGLVLFCWGEDNNDADVINLLKQKKLDAVIYDRIDCFKTPGKENIFKMEHEEKMAMLENIKSTGGTSEPITIILNGNAVTCMDGNLAANLRKASI